jgi:transcriptional regulator with XRE-family HTH domain
MKKYHSLGELLIDYRQIHKLTQPDFAIKLNSDIRTIQRWEKNETNINEEKVEGLVEATLLPFQLIRNLNANDTIPTFFDFQTQKYSLSKLTLEVPDSEWFKRKMNIKTSRIRTIDIDYDFGYLMTYMNISKRFHKNLFNVFREASLICPEMNLIITDELGYYAGYSIVLPLSKETYRLIRSKEKKMEELIIQDIVNYKFQEKPHFISFNLSADCNENIQYLVGRRLNFFKNLVSKDYIFARYENRNDANFISKQIGLKQVWTDGYDSMHFSEGSLKQFLEN